MLAIRELVAHSRPGGAEPWLGAGDPTGVPAVHGEKVAGGGTVFPEPQARPSGLRVG
jgi:hypothetical protein